MKKEFIFISLLCVFSFAFITESEKGKLVLEPPPDVCFEFNTVDTVMCKEDQISAYAAIEETATMLKDNPKLIIELKGYAVPEEKSPNELAFLRAKKVKEIFIEEFEIHPDRLFPKANTEKIKQHLKKQKVRFVAIGWDFDKNKEE